MSRVSTNVNEEKLLRPLRTSVSFLIDQTKA
jgi:hypothetical protein